MRLAGAPSHLPAALAVLVGIALLERAEPADHFVGPRARIAISALELVAYITREGLATPRKAQPAVGALVVRARPLVGKRLPHLRCSVLGLGF